MKPWQDYRQTISSCGHAFFAVCDNLMNLHKKKDWANNKDSPNNHMDANMVIHDIILNHDIEFFTEEGEISEIGDYLFSQTWEFASKLNQKMYL